MVYSSSFPSSSSTYPCSLASLSAYGYVATKTYCFWRLSWKSCVNYRQSTLTLLATFSRLASLLMANSVIDSNHGCFRVERNRKILLRAIVNVINLLRGELYPSLICHGFRRDSSLCCPLWWRCAYVYIICHWLRRLETIVSRASRVNFSVALAGDWE